jgi:transcription elongation GreA/GreB family factor
MSVAFVREESAEAAQEVTLPERPISTHPNLVTQSGLRALEQAVADAREALRAAQLIGDANERRRALELAARDARYFSERLATAALRPDPTGVEVVAFGHRVTIVRDDDRRHTYRIVGEDEADPRVGSISYVSPLARRLIGARVGDFIDMDGHEIQIVEIA